MQITLLLSTLKATSQSKDSSKISPQKVATYLLSTFQLLSGATPLRRKQSTDLRNIPWTPQLTAHRMTWCYFNPLKALRIDELAMLLYIYITLKLWAWFHHSCLSLRSRLSLFASPFLVSSCPFYYTFL
jgi:hypothetical protein